MRFVVQCVNSSSVTVDGRTVGKIGKGLLVLCAIAQSDTRETADRMVKKLCSLRVFRDSQGKTNLNINDVGGQLLIISQFTLYADLKGQNRPGFSYAGKPDMAEPLYRYVLGKAKEYVDVVENGIFGADMEVSLVNDGPFTIILDSDELFS